MIINGVELPDDYEEQWAKKKATFDQIKVDTIGPGLVITEEHIQKKLAELVYASNPWLKVFRGRR